MADLTDFEDSIRAEVPACPHAIVMNELRAAIRDFCGRTWVAQEDIEESTTPNSGEHDLEADDASFEVIGIVSLFIGDKQIFPKNRQWLDRYYPTWRTATTPSGGSWYMQTTPSIFLLAPFTASDGIVETMKICQAIQPKVTTDSVPALLLERYKEQVSYGAKWRILRMAGKDWADPKAAAMYMNLFYRECNKIRTQIDRNFTTEPLRASAGSRWE